jgi:hypothetical protein
MRNKGGTTEAKPFVLCGEGFFYVKESNFATAKRTFFTKKTYRLKAVAHLRKASMEVFLYGNGGLNDDFRRSSQQGTVERNANYI